MDSKFNSRNHTPFLHHLRLYLHTKSCYSTIVSDFKAISAKHRILRKGFG